MRALPLLVVLPLVAGPAFAQVSAEDVWAATEAYWEPLGVAVEGEPVRAGAVLTVGGIVARGALPFGFGTLEARSPDLVLTERGDGTVLVDTANPSTTVVTVSVAVPGRPLRLALPATLAWEGREMVASGTPDAVVFTLDADRVDFDLGPLSGLGATGPDRPDPGPDEQLGLSVSAGIAPLRQVTTIRPAATPDGLVEMESDYDWGESVMDYALAMPFGGGMRMVAWSAPTHTTSQARLPATGVPVTGIAAALRRGMMMEATSQAEASQQISLTTAPDGTIVESSQSSEGSTSTFTIGEDGLSVLTALRGLAGRSDVETLPEPLEYRAGAATWEVTLPLLAGDDQRVALAVALRDATLGEATWAALDPDRVLPRDPGAFTLSIEGRVGLPFDPVSPLAWGVTGLRAASGEFPVDLGPMTATLAAEGAGAVLRGEAAFDFDKTDLATFDGLPRPEGRADLAATGLGALLDDLAAMGVLPPGALDGLRDGLARTFRQTGPDALASDLVIGPDGGVTLNGRLLD